MLPAPSDTVHCGHCGQLFANDALFCPACGTAKARNFDADPLLGTRVGERFLIVERLGHGASGTIYKAEHITLRRKVAVKVLHDELSRDDLAVERFRREATTVSEIDNEHIVQIHDFGRIDDGRLYLAMELLEGETLDQVLEREQKLPVEQVVDILIQLGEALMEAHAMGYIHRDLRPRNIYLAVRRGRANFVKLLDFGLAKLVEKEGEAASTSLGMTFGEPKYMSPEQARGEPVDRRADIYSLGCIAYEMLTGAPPFASGKVFDILTRHVDTAPEPVDQHRRDVPRWLSAAVMRMLAKKADDRFITVYRLIEALRQGEKTGEVMSDAVARRRETNPPASVSQAVEKLGRTALGQAPGPKEKATLERAAEERRREVGKTTAKNQPVDVTPVPRPIPGLMDVRDTERNSDRIERELSRAEKIPLHVPADDDDDEEDLRKTVRRDSGPRKRESASGKKHARDAGTSSAGLSAAWYADGELADDEDLDASQQRKLDRARAVIAPGDDDTDYFPTPRNRVPIIAGALGGLVLLIALLAYFWPKGGDGEATATNDETATAAAANNTLPPAPANATATTTADAGAAAAVPEPAKPVEPEPTKSEPKKSEPKKTEPKKVVKRDPDPPEVPKVVPDPDPPKVDTQDKQKADFLAKMGQTSLNQGDILGATSSFHKALQLDPKNAAAVTGLGEIALSQGSYKAAITHLKKATQLRSGNSRIWTLLGDAYLNAGDNASAKKAFKKALQINPNNAAARDGFNDASADE